MNIIDKIDVYLTEKGEFKKISKKDAYKKMISTIRSCKTKDQLKTAARMAIKFEELYPNFLDRIIGNDDNYGPPDLNNLYGIFSKIIKDKEEMIKHMDKVERSLDIK